MVWRLSNKDFEKNKGAGNKELMKKLVKKKVELGIIVYIGDKPAAWCSVAPREQFVRLENSRVWKRIDEETVWSLTCMFIREQYRRTGFSTEVIKFAVSHCRKKGVKIIEAYPVEPYSDNIPAAFAWTGMPSAFLRAGFREVERRSRSKPIMRYFL